MWAGLICSFPTRYHRCKLYNGISLHNTIQQQLVRLYIGLQQFAIDDKRAVECDKLESNPKENGNKEKRKDQKEGRTFNLERYKRKENGLNLKLKF